MTESSQWVSQSLALTQRGLLVVSLNSDVTIFRDSGPKWFPLTLRHSQLPPLTAWLSVPVHVFVAVFVSSVQFREEFIEKAVKWEEQI